MAFIIYNYGKAFSIPLSANLGWSLDEDSIRFTEMTIAIYDSLVWKFRGTANMLSLEGLGERNQGGKGPTVVERAFSVRL